MKRTYSIALVALTGLALLFLAKAQTHIDSGLNDQVATARRTIRVYALDGGVSHIDDKGMFGEDYRDEGKIDLRVMSFLIVHPEGTLLWDTGLPDSLMKASPASGGIRTAVTRGLEAQLAEIGYAPEDIDYLALSHWHFDHSGNANLFAGKATTIIGQRDEYDFAFSSKAADGFGMQPETYDKVRSNPTDLFIGDRDVFGDGSVVIMRTPGHTMGSQVLYVELEHQGPILLSGDLWHFAEQHEHSRVPPFNEDHEETKRSMDRILRFLASRPRTRLWITHDAFQMGAVALSPSFYD